MHTVFLISAAVGGTVLVLQLLLLLVGLGDSDAGGAEAGHDVSNGMASDAGEAASAEGETGDGSLAFFKIISFKTLTAFFTFFGLGGLLAESYELEAVWSILIALGCGLVALYLVGYMWMLLHRLEASGNVDLRNTVGTVGRVYVSIPGGGEGRGKVTVHVQGRSLEVNALTDGDPIPTGTEVRVVELVGPETVKVTPLVVRKE